MWPWGELQINYTTAVSEARIGTVPVEWVRQMELDDFDGLLPKRHLRFIEDA